MYELGVDTFLTSYLSDERGWHSSSHGTQSFKLNASMSGSVRLGEIMMVQSKYNTIKTQVTNEIEQTK